LVIYSKKFDGMPADGAASLALSDLASIPLLLPSADHGLRALIDQGFAKVHCVPRLIAEIDGLAMLMDAVGAGLGVTIQPGAALARQDPQTFRSVPLDDVSLVRPNRLVSLCDEELSPAGLAARVVMTNVVRALVKDEAWIGATLPNGRDEA
jgi:LysR family tcuABC transcriptional regulator